MPYADPEKQREYQRLWAARRRVEWLEENGPCALCGSSEKLEVDHVDPALKVSHRVWSWSKARREAELAKCRVLCEPCHAARTLAQVRTGACSAGHPWTPETTEWNDKEHRSRTCKLCRRERHRRNRAKKHSGIAIVANAPPC